MRPLLCLALLLPPPLLAAAPEPVRVLVITGRNNHDWERSLPLLVDGLEKSGRFVVEVSRTPGSYAQPQPARPPKNATPEQEADYGKAMAAWMEDNRAHEEAMKAEWPKWNPDFSRHQVVVNHYNGNGWPEAVKASFTEFVRKGGGVVNIHAANNAFKDWPEFNEMLGIGWRGAEGRRIVVDEATGKAVELPPGAETGKGASAGHGGVHAFDVIHREPAHPILLNLPVRWKHGRDELYHGQRGPAQNLNILASAFSDPKTGGSGRHEPVLWWVPFGKGRVVTTSLGHLWRGQPDLDAFTCVGFQTVVARAAEWAATGRVTLPTPDGFPSAHRVSLAGPEGVRWQGAAASVNTYKKGELRFPALPPEESLKQIELPAGYRVELVASEPLIQEPVWVAWDGNGALYVAEMNSYMQDAHGTGTKTERNGRIKRLVDTDGDGRMDRATVFADGLLLPRMILPLDERVLVQETDQTGFWSLRDADGDGVAEERLRPYPGRAASGSVEHQDSALTWNLDNWMYTAEGGERHRFTRGKWETERCFAEFNQWGLGMDDTGRLYFSQNSIPGRGFQLPWHAWNLPGERLKWKKFERPSLGADTDAAFQLIYPLFPVGDRGESMGGSWTSACGLSIYRGHALPAEMRGSMLLCEPCSHLVRRARVVDTPDGVRLENQDPFTEFFLSRDFYTRPVQAATGPDGALYIVDMYRGIIQDSPWVSGAFIDRIRDMGMDQVKNRGRLYRVAHESHKPVPAPRLLDLKPADLVPHLASSNGWVRDTAQKLLVLRGDASVKPALQDAARAHAEPLARLHALWTLEGLDALDLPLLATARADADPRVRAAAVRLHDPWIRAADPHALAAVLAAAEDSDPLVLQQVILTLGQTRTVLGSEAPAESTKPRTALEPEAPAESSKPLADNPSPSRPKPSPYQTAQDTIQTIARRHVAHGGIFLATLTALYGETSLPLVKEIEEGSLFRSLPDATTRARVQARWKAGLEAWKGKAARPREHSPDDIVLLEKGAATYDAVCATCHGADGRGVTPPGQPALAPPLAGSALAQGPKEALIRVLLHGLTGPVGGVSYPGNLMAPLGQGLPDDAVAGVLSFIRQEWINQAPVIRPDEVAAVRALTASRASPFTQEELTAFAAPPLTNRAAWVATSADHTPANAIDGKVNASHQNAWHGQNKPGCWLAVDLGAPHRLTHVVMESVEPAYYPRGWEIRVSDDGKSWSEPLATGRGDGMRTLASFEPRLARHLKITQTGQAVDRWMVSELHVHGQRE